MNKISNFQNKTFNIFIWITYFLIIATAIGVSNSNVYLDDLDYYIRIYICAFLIYRFNPFRKLVHFTELDRNIAYNAGVFILTTTIINEYLITYINEIKNYLHTNTFFLNK
jgi:hypothetical protein